MALKIKKVEKWAQKKNVPKLIKALTTKEIDMRKEVIKALGTIKDDNAMYSLIRLLEDPDDSIRAATVDALGTMKNGRSIEFVRKVLNNDKNEEIRGKAKLAIAEIREVLSSEEKH